MGDREIKGNGDRPRDKETKKRAERRKELKMDKSEGRCHIKQKGEKEEL